MSKRKARNQKLTEDPNLGRPRKWASEMPVYDNYKEAEAGTGISKSVLMQAVEQGCQCKRNQRLHIGEFIRWFFTVGLSEDDSKDWEEVKGRFSALREKLKFEKEDDKVIDWALVERFIDYLVKTLFFGEVDRLASEFPANLKGKTEIEIFEECARQAKMIKETLRGAMDDWIEKKGKL